MTERPTTVHALLLYSLEEHRLLEQHIFDESEEVDEDARSEMAISAYFQMEQEHRNRKDVEIVLIGADSLKTIQATHGSYFRETVAVDATSVEELLQQLIERLAENTEPR